MARVPKATFAIPTTDYASVNFPHGTAPSSAYEDGDIWTTTGGVYARVNGVTVLLGTGGGIPLTDGDKGDITVSGSGATWTIDNNVVTFAKMQDISTEKLIGKHTSGSGDPEQVGLDGGLEFFGANIRRSALTGAITASAGNNTTALGSFSLTALSTALSATGTPSATTYLRGDNTWATPTGGGNTFQFLDGGETEEPMIVPGPPGMQGPAGADGVIGRTGDIIFLEPDEPELPMLIPGPQGATGATGSNGSPGAQGTPGVSVFVTDGEDGLDGMPVPGPQGIQGPAGSNGSAGAQGAPGVAVFVMDGQDGIDGMPIPGPPGAAGAGGGDVTGPASSTDNGIPRFDLTTGKILQTSYATISDDGLVSTLLNSGACAATLPATCWVMLTADYTLTNVATEQKAFNTTTNGRLTLPTGVYEFECFLYLTTMSGTSGNLAFDPIGAGTAVTDRWGQQAWGIDSTTPLNAAARGGSASVTQQTPASAVTAATGTGFVATFNGMFRISTGGTIIPSVTLVTAAAAVVKAGSWFKISKIGESTVTSVGAWT